MNRRRIYALVTAAALLFAAGTLTPAQAQARRVKVDFPFVAAGKALAPGTYAIDVAPSGNVVLTAEGGAAVEIPDTKKLNDRNVSRTELMFDVVGSARFLAQVKLPEKGHFVVGRQEGAVEQETVKAPKADK